MSKAAGHISGDRLREFIETSENILLLELNRDGRVLQANEAAHRILPSAEGLVGKSLAELLTGLAAAKLDDLASRFCGIGSPAGSIFEINTQADHPSRFLFKGEWLGDRLVLLGEPCPDEVCHLRERLEDFRTQLLDATRALGKRTMETGRLMSTLEDMEMQVERLTRMDALTGLANRRAFMEMARREWQRFRRYGRGYSVLIVGLDHMDDLVEAYGLTAGEAAVVMVGKILQAKLRNTDHLARFSNDTFGVMMCETPSLGACVVGSRLCTAVSEKTIRVGEDITLTVSVGVSSALPGDEHPDHVVRRASAACRKASVAEGGNTCVSDDTSGISSAQ